MNILYLYLTIFLIFLAFMLLIYEWWLPSFKPNWFKRYMIFDDAITKGKEYLIFLPIKGDHDSYTINDREYSNKEKKPKSINNIDTWYFTISNSLPIDFFKSDSTVDSRLANDIKNESLDSLWDNGGFDDILRKYWWVFILVGILLIGAFIYSQNNSSQNKLLEICLNSTRR